jgi:hypothetical protein
MLIAAAREGNLSRRVSEEGGEKVYRSEKAAGRVAKHGVTYAILYLINLIK